MFARNPLRGVWPLLTLALLPVPALGQDHAHAPGEARAESEVPLYDNLGTLHHAVTTTNPQAQRYFDQGLRLYYAFNHAEAVRAFREAQRLDPRCSMCFWGEALALGPNINLPMDSAAAVAAYAALQGAMATAQGVSSREQALVSALSARYEATPRANRAPLDSAYAAAMADLHARYPQDDDIAVLYGEALMDLRPWDYWIPGERLHPGVLPARALFTQVKVRSPEHPGACHFYIHLVEKEQPEQAVDCAERLAGLMPGAGHLVHMPGHIYIRVGRYHDAIRANRHAVHADESYIADQRPGMGVYTAGYYPHNYDFLAFAATMVGLEDVAVMAADKMVEVIPAAMVASPALTFLQHYIMRPFQIRVRFQRWDEILAAPAPPQGLLHSTGMWHYARGRALVGTGDPAAADTHLEALRRLAYGADLEGVRLEFNPSQTVLRIATEVLAGHVAAAEGREADAVEHLRAAVGHEDSLLYGEPPEWTVPTRQELAEMLLGFGRVDEAAQVFQADLDRFPDNGWSLRGLAAARRAQGRHEEAMALARRAEAIWAVDPDAR